MTENTPVCAVPPEALPRPAGEKVGAGKGPLWTGASVSSPVHQRVVALWSGDCYRSRVSGALEQSPGTGKGLVVLGFAAVISLTLHQAARMGPKATRT